MSGSDGERCAPVTAKARRRPALISGIDDDTLAREIERRSHSILGKITVEKGRGAFPLSIETARAFAANRIALVGEAAHLIPPIGAQGLNLGLRDAFALADSLRAGCTPQALQTFADRHRLDRAVTIGVTDLLPRAFGVGGALAAHARGASLAALACV